MKIAALGTKKDSPDYGTFRCPNCSKRFTADKPDRKKRRTAGATGT